MWILKTSGEIHFKRTAVGEEILGTRLDSNLSYFLSKVSGASACNPNANVKIALCLLSLSHNTVQMS